MCTTFPGNNSQRVEINGSCKDQLITTGFNSRYDKAQVFKAMSGVYAVIWLPMFFSKQNSVYFHRFPVIIKLSNIVDTFENDNFNEKWLTFCMFMKKFDFGREQMYKLEYFLKTVNIALLMHTSL